MGKGLLVLLFILGLQQGRVQTVCPLGYTGSVQCDVTVKTGTLLGASSDGTIYIRFIGNGSSGETDLENPGNDFEQGHADHYQLTVPASIFPVTHIGMRQDYPRAYDDWYFEYVDVLCPDAGTDMHFPAQLWLSAPSSLDVTLAGHNNYQCPSRQSISNGQVQCDNNNFSGSRCVYTCHDNYLLDGPDCVQCQRSQQWNHREGSQQCRELCHWRRSHCWPGQCSGPTGQQLATSCTCQAGFRLTTNSGARCDLDMLPVLSTCRVAVTDSGRSSTNSSYTGPSRDCRHQRDEGVKTVPVKLYVALKAGRALSLTGNQSYVSRSNVGVIGLYLTVVHKHLAGDEVTVIDRNYTDPPYCQRSVSSLDPIINGIEHDCEQTVDLPPLTMHDGDSLCADMKAAGGGFYTVNSHNDVFWTNVTFTPTYSVPKRVCFTYDRTSPVHCSQSGLSCHSQPLTLSTRLTRHPEVEVTVDGWVDPRPPGGESNSKSASGVERFQLEVHRVNVGQGNVSVEHGAVTELTQQWNVSSYSYPTGAEPYTLTARLPHSDGARLYALILEAHDKAGNVRYARRLVLYDNSSAVALTPHTTISVVHANPRSGNKWQTDISLPVCVNWTGHFYNTDMRVNNFLLPVTPDSILDIRGLYDQTSGLLPVTGTDNVVGVTLFEVSWRVDDTDWSSYTPISDVFAQTTCIQHPLTDGQTYDVLIRATDIMNNSLVDSVRISVDHTGPKVSTGGLRGRWDTGGLYVHNSTDLSTMRLVLTASDPHSGLASIHWALGTRPLAADVGQAAVGVQRLGNETNCSSYEHCYCPSVGVCEIFQYLVTFPSLVANHTHQGDHHRQYFITIAVTNTASLTTVTTLDLLLDESPPTVGVVWEGLSLDGQAEMDYTSSGSVQARWHGYEDPESGLRLYRAVLDQRCLTAAEVDSAPNATVLEHPQTSATFLFPHEGRFYVSVVGYNGALEPSQVACSDGITYDTTPPAFFNVSLTHARSGRMVGCTQGGAAWLVNSNLTRVALSNVTQCGQVCALHATDSDVSHLPLSSPHTLDPQLSHRHCRNLPTVSQDSAIVLPSDYVRVTWRSRDAASETEEYYVGIGRDRTTRAAPDLLPLTPTHGHPFYHARHMGLSHGDILFIFLQAVNKAGLTTILTLGPVIIDVTPPEVTKPLAAVVEGNYLQVTWTDDVFADPEQPQNVGFDFTFRVCHESGFVTLYLDLPESLLAACRHDNVSGCARYPINELYNHDSQDGHSFYVQLHVTNAAGHVTIVNTSAARLPSRSPPSHAVVLDVVKITDPVWDLRTSQEFASPTSATHFNSDSSRNAMTTVSTDLNSDDSLTSTVPLPDLPLSGDIDVILQRQEVCVAWTGLHHPEEVSVDIGLGTTPDLDDAIKFHQVQNVGYACFNLSSAPVFTKLFSVVRATSSGGTSIFSSDGFVMVPPDILGNVRVFNGPGCSDSAISGRKELIPPTHFLDFDQILTYPIHPGDFLFVQLFPFLDNVTFTNAIVIETTLSGYQLVTSSNNVTINVPDLSNNHIIQVSQCQKNSRLLGLSVELLHVSWEVGGPWQVWLQQTNVGLLDRDCLQTAVKKSVYGRQQCVLHEVRVEGKAGEARLSATNVIAGRDYVTTLQPCFDNGCLTPITSDPVTFLHEAAMVLTFQEAILVDQVGGQLEVMAVASVRMPISGGQRTPLCVYQWGVSTDNQGVVTITGWIVEQTDNCSDIQVRRATPFTGEAKGKLYFCLQPLYPWRSAPTCRFLRPSPTSRQHQPYHVVELDHRTVSRIDVQPFTRSQQLGGKLHDLFDLDLDFASSDVMLSAVMTYSEGMNVTWFLMTDRHVPDLNDCAGDGACVTSVSDVAGYVTLPRHRSGLQNRQVYFLCAAAASASEPSRQARLCGNGVVIDDDPPAPGTVTIDNAHNGFLADREQVRVVWSGFRDLQPAGWGRPQEATLTYSLALGQTPGTEDVAKLVVVGGRTSWSFLRVSLQAGAPLYVTVTAQDRVGHVTKVTSDMVIVDHTPPSIDLVAAGTITEETFVGGPELPIHWEGVEDKESGILTVEVAVAVESGGNIVVNFQPCQGTSTTIAETSSLVDGHSYVILLKASNRAGLSTVKSSQPFIVDSTPPVPGRVWFSGHNTSTPILYSSEVGVVRVQWAGFTDPHSGLQSYRVGLGSSPRASDVLPLVHVGLHTSHTWRAELEEGRKYYATVETCNRAGLCVLTASGSLAFDNSPPTPGHVTVGLYGAPDKFLGHNNSLPVQWTGFSDPQTGVQHFTCCVGTLPGNCDITDPISSLLSKSAHLSGLALPKATPLYVTVRATNPAGLESVGVSQSFKVDTTPPELVKRPHFLSLRDDTPAEGQWDRSQLHVTWQFRDPESSVVSHVVYIRSKATGRPVVGPVELGGQEKLILTLDERTLLADGDAHWASVTACNAAHLCLTALSDVIFLDSRPPVPGTFLSPLLWTSPASEVTSIDVTWRGFSDAESEVVSYELLAGRDYNGQELTEGRVTVTHSNASLSQTTRLQIQGGLQEGQVLHLALLAQNALGLRSPLIRAAFTSLQDSDNATSGTLVLVRHSCQSSYCTNECTCAAAGKVCQGSHSDCEEMDPSRPELFLYTLLPLMGPPGSQHQQFSTSAKCLEGHWSLLHPEAMVNVSRFQYSFSLANMTAGQGVMDPRSEPVWHDVGRDVRAVHCLPGNRTLESGQRYMLHVRLWPTVSSSLAFVSPPVIVDHTPPQLRRGRTVIEADPACRNADMDYVTKEGSPVRACWSDVFVDSQSPVVNYQVWVGTKPHGSDYMQVTDVGLNTSWTIPTTSLEHGTHYYVTVCASNAAGLQTTAVSDGFLVDIEPPVPGVVFNNDRHGNAHAQSSASTLSASWHGFQDAHSGVRSYQVAVYDVFRAKSVLDFTNVGIQSKVRLNNLTLEHNHSYTVAVKAVDGAGLQSQVSESPAILVDVTSPEGVTCANFTLQEVTHLAPQTVPTSQLYQRYTADLTVAATERGQLVRVEVSASRLSPLAAGFLRVNQREIPLRFVISPTGLASATHELLSMDQGALSLQVTVQGPPAASLTALLYHCPDTVVSPHDAVTVRQMSASSLSVCARVRDAESGLRTVMVGVGTTRGGLQVAPWTFVAQPGHMTFPVHVQHATPVYVTVVAQNQAGLWSRFHSQPLSFDLTPPLEPKVNLTLKYDDATTVWADVSWLSGDNESGVAFCTCGIEGQTSEILSTFTWRTPDRNRCQWQLPDPRHGSMIRAVVTCVNGVQLQSVGSSGLVPVLRHPPDVSQVLLTSLYNSVFMSHNSSLQFTWRGVQDPSVDILYFRFLGQSRPLTEWFPLPPYKTAAMLELEEGEGTKVVTGQIKAVNARLMTSEVVSRTALLDAAAPTLTGDKATVSVAGNDVRLDWSQVFQVTRDVTFSLFVGTSPGYGDVINHVATSEMRYVGRSAVTLTPTLYVIILAAYDTGAMTAYCDELFL